MKAKERNRIFAEILINFGFNLSMNWFNYNQADLAIIDRLAKAMNVKGSQGRCPGRTLWDRAKEGRPF